VCHAIFAGVAEKCTELSLYTGSIYILLVCNSRQFSSCNSLLLAFLVL